MYAPGPSSELTQIADFALMDAVLDRDGRAAVRSLPSRAVVYVVLALALSEASSCRNVQGKLVAAPERLALVRPAAPSLSRARQQTGAAPLRRLPGPVAHRGQTGAIWHGLRTAAADGTLLHTR